MNRPRSNPVLWSPVLVATVAGGCADPVERSTRADLAAVERTLAEPAADLDDTASRPAPDFDGTLPAYLAYAFERSPSLRASFETWRAATYRPRQQRRMPEPTITYAGFVRSVETRVGPQRHRLGAMQWFPWPSKLGAGGKAASLEAQAAQRRFEADALQIAAEVSAAYWSVWRVQRRREVLSDEVEILGSLSAQVRTRVEVNMAELADLSQIDLMVARSKDRVAGLDESQRAAEAELVRAIGAPDGTPVPVATQAPAVAELAEPVERLTADAGRHPRVDAWATMSDAANERVRQARADRFPSFGVGVDWILTGPSAAAMPPPDSGKDAVALSVSLKVPIWLRAYRAAEEEARATSAAARSRAIAARDAVIAEVRRRAAQLDDDIRRVKVHDTTLVPQAEAAFESVLSSYAAGRSSVAELLMAERELIALEDELRAAEADYGTHFAQLEAAVGRSVRTKEMVRDER